MISTIFAVFMLHVLVASAQLCDDTEVSQILHPDITTLNGIFSDSIALQGEALVTDQGVNLTSAAIPSDADPNNPEGFGGFFFKSPTNFQGDGGFSSKFALQTSEGMGGGEAWEFIIANQNSLDIVPPPYSSGSANFGSSGWSRARALVIEFDTDDSSGVAEQDTLGIGTHIAMYLNGVEQCETGVTSSFSDGGLYYIWVDYIGFSTTLEVRVSPNGENTRPATATARCSVDVWSVLDITQDNYVGFAAYNPAKSLGSEHSLVEVLTLTDAYRPYDTRGTCASYSNCRLKSENSLCTKPNGDSVTCTIETCPPVYVWDVSGASCCAFVEKASWRITGSAVGVTSGSSVTCEEKRTTIVYATNLSNCI
jgi:hypothetical protein